eukprot:jgi/Botrbrau1/17463/Bobra.0054s0050.1
MHRSTSFVSAPLGQDVPSSRATKYRRPHAKNASGALLMICGLSAAVLFTIYTMIQPRIQLHQKAKLNFTIQGSGVSYNQKRATGLTAVMYVFSGSDPEYEQNLLFFLQEAVQEGDNCDYFIVIQQGKGLRDPVLPPSLPSNVHVLYHPNECFDLGTIGWLLAKETVDTRLYTYFIWLNSSVRGPFLPSYVRGRLHWTTPFTERLRGAVKLVGSTINCGGAYLHAPTPHVQSYISATDVEGLAILLEEGVFACRSELGEVVVKGELAASTVILAAGYNIDCLLLRYQGLDWREAGAQHCNEQLNPIQEGLYDGISINPLEVMFVKVKRAMLEAGWEQVRQATKYDAWLSLQRSWRPANPPPEVWSNISSNAFVQRLPELQKRLGERGEDCFDHDFYFQASHNDLGLLAARPDAAHWAFTHFIRNGLREGRPYRFLC